MLCHWYYFGGIVKKPVAIICTMLTHVHRNMRMHLLLAHMVAVAGGQEYAPCSLSAVSIPTNALPSCVQPLNQGGLKHTQQIIDGVDCAFFSRSGYLGMLDPPVRSLCDFLNIFLKILLFAVTRHYRVVLHGPAHRVLSPTL